ncbi:hypothetical protein ACFL6X_05015 [Candidatus Latescibacterota bacterium]
MSASTIPSETPLHRFPTCTSLARQTMLQEGDWAETAGFGAPGDGGAAIYSIQPSTDDTRPNGADVIALDGGMVARLQENQAANYKMFGAVGDGVNDDGVQIMLAHEYANRRRIPVIQRSGEFWIKQTNSIPIQTSVDWGQATFHIDERYNTKQHFRFVVHNDRPTEELPLDGELKAALLAQIRPGVQLIPELAPYAGCLVSVVDEGDRIGIRAGNYHQRGWAREELLYVEEEGRIIGDIAWEFGDLTSVTVTPCNESYLVIEGGGFYFSGDSAVGGETGYHRHGISIERSRTIVREQWMGLERGQADVSLEPRSGFYVLTHVYDVTLENIRAMPWEYHRQDPSRVLKAGTYGIGGARMLNCTFRNLTAEGGWMAWGVFGTNLNKNFRVENCRLNRIDVHFHCWNLYISNCTIGFKGISVTGGGDLFIDNTTRHGTTFVSFRPDYGSRWDGHVRLRGCTYKPSGTEGVAVLSFRPRNFDYQYPIGYARSIAIEDMLIDYGAAPQSTAPCWLMAIAPFSQTDDGSRLFFPHHITFRNITVEGRGQGVRVLHIVDPHLLDLGRGGAYDGSLLSANCTIVCDRIQLEKVTPQNPEDTEQMHMVLGDGAAREYADGRGLHPVIRFVDCDNVAVYLGNSIASAHFDRCTVNTVHAPGVRGELAFTSCHLRPEVAHAPAALYAVDSTLGTRFTNCTVHAPVIDGESRPEEVDRVGFLQINGPVQHYHLNTGFANEVLDHLKQAGVGLEPEFVFRLRSHHCLDG